MSVRTLFQAPTVAGLIARLDLSPSLDAVGAVLPIRVSGNKHPFFCIHPAAGVGWCYMPLARYVPADYPVYGLQAAGLDGMSPLSSSLEEMAAGHVGQIRALQETGPYYLLGWSFGGIVAHEVAVQLQAAGQQVHLIIMDGYPPDHGADPAPASGEDDPAELPGTGSSTGEEAPAHDRPPAEIVSRLRQEWGYMLAGISDEELMTSMRVLKNNRRLALEHSFGEFAGDTLLIVAAKGRDQDDAPAAAGWRAYITGEIIESWLPCGHMEMAQPEMLTQVWDRISMWLRRES